MTDFASRVDDVAVTAEQIAAVRRLLATQPDAEVLADALGVA